MREVMCTKETVVFVLVSIVFMLQRLVKENHRSPPRQLRFGVRLRHHRAQPLSASNGFARLPVVL